MLRTRIRFGLWVTGVLLANSVALPTNAVASTPLEHDALGANNVYARPPLAIADPTPIKPGRLPSPLPPPVPPTPPPAPPPPTNGTNPDSTLLTSYTISGSGTSVNWIVCGSTQQTEGCYDFGSLGPFGKVGALIEGNPVVDVATNTVTRNIYVVDQAVGGGTGVTLFIYKKVDAISSTFDTTTVTLADSVPLTLTGGTSATTYMAANDNYLFIGTNQSAFAEEVSKSTFYAGTIGGFSPPINVSAITADAYGFVTVTFGGTTGENGFYTFSPNGSLNEDGGGAQYVLGTTAGLTTANLETASSTAAAIQSLSKRIQVRIKAISTQDVSGNVASH